MTNFVLDCSIAMSWCFEDEASPHTDEVLDLIYQHEAWVPNLWHLEVTNVLVTAAKRDRITINNAKQRLDLLGKLPIKTDTETFTRAFDEIHTLASELSLTSYDAAYLELAQRKTFALATKDTALRKAAETLGVKVL